MQLPGVNAPSSRCLYLRLIPMEEIKIKVWAKFVTQMKITRLAGQKTHLTIIDHSLSGTRRPFMGYLDLMAAYLKEDHL